MLTLGHLCRNWDWFVRDKPKLLQYLAEVTKRPIAMLRMDSGWKHRLKMENIEALESVKTNETRFRSSADYVSTPNLHIVTMIQSNSLGLILVLPVYLFHNIH